MSQRDIVGLVALDAACLLAAAMMLRSWLRRRARPPLVAAIFGTASWTDPTMTAPGVFYPRGADSAEERLRFYASKFSVVEVDSTYYALPNKRTAESWVERTPKGFVFDIKAHALMTGQPTEQT